MKSDIDNAFLGIGWTFPPTFHKRTNELAAKMVSEEQDIYESLYILLSTKPGERVMQPSYGCGLHAMVHETINDSTITAITDVIERAVLFFEPRVTLNDIDVNIDEAYEGKLKITLNYTIRKTNTRSNIVYPFYYLEGNHVRI